MAFAYNPKTSSVTIDYIGLKANNAFYWLSEKAWNHGYASDTLQDISPKGRLVYEDGTTPTDPI